MFLTTRAALELTARCKKALSEAGIHDVNPAQASILLALDRRQGITPTQIAHEVLYEKSTITPLLEKLSAAGLLSRVKDPKDGRVQRMSLTRKGLKRLKEVEVVMSAIAAALADEVPKKTFKHHTVFCQTVLDIEV